MRTDYNSKCSHIQHINSFLFCKYAEKVVCPIDRRDIGSKNAAVQFGNPVYSSLYLSIYISFFSILHHLSLTVSQTLPLSFSFFSLFFSLCLLLTHTPVHICSLVHTFTHMQTLKAHSNTSEFGPIVRHVRHVSSSIASGRLMCCQ